MNIKCRSLSSRLNISCVRYVIIPIVRNRVWGRWCVLPCHKDDTRLKYFIIKQMHKFIIRRTIRIIIKYLKLLQHISDHKGSIMRELYTVLGCWIITYFNRHWCTVQICRLIPGFVKLSQLVWKIKLGWERVASDLLTHIHTCRH